MDWRPCRPTAIRDYARLRREFALRAPGERGGALPLDGFFGLHPALDFMQQCYAARELIVLHALASPYRERSHFDGQDVLENGSPRPHALADRLAQSRARRRARAAAARGGRGARPERAARDARAGGGDLVVALEARRAR